MYTPLSPNSKLTGMGGRPRARDKMWTLQLWVWGRGVRGKCIMPLSLLSYYIVLPPLKRRCAALQTAKGADFEE